MIQLLLGTYNIHCFVFFAVISDTRFIINIKVNLNGPEYIVPSVQEQWIIRDHRWQQWKMKYLRAISNFTLLTVSFRKLRCNEKTYSSRNKLPRMKCNSTRRSSAFRKSRTTHASRVKREAFNPLPLHFLHDYAS